MNEQTKMAEAICYKSKLLGKYFDNYADLVKEEEAYKKAHAAEIKEREERKKDSDIVSAAYKDYLKAQNDANEKFNAYIRKKNEFINKHGSYHVTYTTPDILINKIFSIFDE